MRANTVKTAVPLPMDRYTPLKRFAAMAVALERSGVVDYQQPWDQLTSWFPNLLWNTRNTPLAAVVPEVDSWSDVYALSAYAAALTENLGVAISLDSVRHGPAELVQTMLTLSNMTDGKAIFMIGGGEQKQCKPFGWRRADGLARMEDLFRINRQVLECDGPFDFEGHHTKFEKAWLGAARQHRPKLWALGGGPKLLEVATKHADGFATMAPYVFSSPENCAERIVEIKQAIAAHGRDPEQFEFGIFAAALLHEDEAVIDRALDNALFRYMAATMGRINMNDWDREGVEPAMPRDWTYAVKLLPSQLTQTDVDHIIGRSTRKMSEKSWIYGTPQVVAAELGRYVDAGVTWVNVIDCLPLILPLEEQPAALPRSIEVCRLLKNR